MKVSLFPDYPEEKFQSIEVYRNNLKVQISKFKSIEIKEILGFKRPSNLVGHVNLKTRLFFRFILNPLLAPFRQGEVNHILDQSYGHLLFFLNPQRTVVTCHDLNPLKFSWKKQWKEKVKKKLYLLSLKGMKRAAKIIAVSQATKRDIIEFLNYPEEKIVVIPEGVNKIFRPIKDKAAYQKILKYKLPNKFILYVGHSGEFKNLKAVLKTFSLLLQNPAFSDFHFVKIGEAFSDSQEKLIKKLKIQNRIKRIPYVPEKDLPLIYNKASCFLHLSLMEGFGLIILEAMACGCPAVASDIPAIRELTEGKIPLVSPNDTKSSLPLLKKILREKNFRERVIKKGLKQAKKFTWQKTALETLKVYESLNP